MPDCHVERRNSQRRKYNTGKPTPDSSQRPKGQDGSTQFKGRFQVRFDDPKDYTTCQNHASRHQANQHMATWEKDANSKVS